MMKMALAVLSGIVLFLLVLPLLMLLAANGIGMALGLPPWPSAPLHLLGLPLAALGLFLVAWSGYALITSGRGTPLPLTPTERLVITGPYALCRNPMVLGELLYLTGLGLLLTSPALLALVWLAFFPAVVAYLKLVEERRLEGRFGEAYLAYKREVPFLLPRPRRSRSGERAKRGPGI